MSVSQSARADWVTFEKPRLFKCHRTGGRQHDDAWTASAFVLFSVFLEMPIGQGPVSCPITIWTQGCTHWTCFNV